MIFWKFPNDLAFKLMKPDSVSYTHFKTNIKQNIMKRFVSSPLTGRHKGIISCIILRYIEEQLQKQDNSQNKLGDYFDLVAGSSTGGLITSIMLYPDENRNARYSIQKAWNCIRKRRRYLSGFFLNG